MAATPIIQSTGSISGAGTAGEGRKNLVPGETVTLSDTLSGTTNSGASYSWSILDQPIGANVTLNNPTTTTPDFTPAEGLPGSYKIECVVDGTFSSFIIIAVPLTNTGSRIPSFEETDGDYNEDGQTKGWHEDQTDFMRAVDAKLGSQANGDYIHSELTSDQTGTFVVNTTPYALNSVLVSRGSLSVDSGGKFSGLRAGRTYQLLASIRISDNIHQYQWYDVTNASFIGSVGTIRSVESSAQSPGNSIALALITPTQDTEVELRFVGGTTTADAVASSQSSAMITEIGSVTNTISGGLEFVDEIEVTSAGQDFTFGAGGDGKLGRALDGDVDEEYVVLGDIITGNSATEFSLEPNNLTSNQRVTALGDLLAAGTDTIQTTSHFTSLMAGRHNGAATGSLISFEATLKALTGAYRGFRSSQGSADDGGNTHGVFQFGGAWKDDSTNITSLVIHADAANGIGVGSRIRLYRRTSRPLRADSATVSERTLSAAVDTGTNGPDAYTLGHTIAQGSVAGFSVRLEEACTAGSVTATLKVDGSTIDSITLSSSGPTQSDRKMFTFGQHSFVHDKNISVELSTSSYDNSGSVSSGVTVVVMLQTDAFIRKSAAGGLEHIKTIRINSTDQTTVTFSNLDGDVDGIYVLEYYVRRLDSNTTTDVDVYVNPNGLATNQQSRRTSPHTSSTDEISRLRIVNMPVSTGWDACNGTMKLFARLNGYNRTYHAETVLHNEANSSGDNASHIFGGAWSDTTTNITSLEIEASQTGNLGIGSEFRLYKLTEGAGDVEVL